MHLKRGIRIGIRKNDIIRGKKKSFLIVIVLTQFISIEINFTAVIYDTNYRSKIIILTSTSILLMILTMKN